MSPAAAASSSEGSNRGESIGITLGDMAERYGCPASHKFRQRIGVCEGMSHPRTDGDRPTYDGTQAVEDLPLCRASGVVGTSSGIGRSVTSQHPPLWSPVPPGMKEETDLGDVAVVYPTPGPFSVP
ncbi:hypothetical protein PC9H_001515 [Pleurotus ostreatus]|uniref:Uncharacterized protein n=1 Tax=Pleurotus ostreatus TaxID=5322 RepID=A0A8H7A6Y9_PLEOS|nr:uncharacterized protein PC9H_001515 [Pleurotus ostreatus]KAF7441166.1 hypothetical protein PC9H_001515 [Pleurotus ostreatus]